MTARTPRDLDQHTFEDLLRTFITEARRRGLTEVVREELLRPAHIEVANQDEPQLITVRSRRVKISPFPLSPGVDADTVVLTDHQTRTAAIRIGDIVDFVVAQAQERLR